MELFRPQSAIRSRQDRLKTPVTEVLCYECTGKYGDAAFVVYINAQSGTEEQLFEIINSDEGEFTV